MTKNLALYIILGIAGCYTLSLIAQAGTSNLAGILGRGTGLFLFLIVIYQGGRMTKKIITKYIYKRS